MTVDLRRAGEIVEASGWDVDGVTTMRDVARVLFPREADLLVDAANERTPLVAGVRS